METLDKATERRLASLPIRPPVLASVAFAGPLDLLMRFAHRSPGRSPKLAAFAA